MGHFDQLINCLMVPPGGVVKSNSTILTSYSGLTMADNYIQWVSDNKVL